MARILLSLAAFIVTSVQSFLLYTEGEGICVSSGCRIVDSFLQVSHLIFNISGSLFFFTLLLCLVGEKSGSEFSVKVAKFLLLSAMAIEAVLIYFQYVVAHAICYYCIAIFSVILLLNILTGPAQLLRSIIMFFAVFSCCLSLSFEQKIANETLDSGTAIIMGKEEDRGGLYLFFSKTCPHCEDVIKEIVGLDECRVRLNPVDQIDTSNFVSFNGVVQSEYNSKLNRTFLQTLSVQEVPVLVEKDGNQLQIIKGKHQILAFLGEKCRTPEVIEYTGTSSVSNQKQFYETPDNSDGDQACTLEADCVGEKNQVKHRSNNTQ